MKQAERSLATIAHRPWANGAFSIKRDFNNECAGREFHRDDDGLLSGSPRLISLRGRLELMKGDPG
jgi:hypothetical protein